MCTYINDTFPVLLSLLFCQFGLISKLYVSKLITTTFDLVNVCVCVSTCVVHLKGYR